MKFLNLDDLAKHNRTLTIGGVEHVVEEMTVGNFIETTNAASKMGENPTFRQQVDATIDMILRSVPTLKREELNKLPLEKLTTIIRFIRGELDVEEPTKAEEDKPEGKSKK